MLKIQSITKMRCFPSLFLFTMLLIKLSGFICIIKDSSDLRSRVQWVEKWKNVWVIFNFSSYRIEIARVFKKFLSLFFSFVRHRFHLDNFFAFLESLFVRRKSLKQWGKKSIYHLKPFCDFFWSRLPFLSCRQVLSAAIDFNYFHLRYFYRSSSMRAPMMNVLSPIKNIYTKWIYDTILLLWCFGYRKMLLEHSDQVSFKVFFLTPNGSWK